MAHSLHPDFDDAEQVSNPWDSNDRGPSQPTAATATNRQRGDTDSVLCNDAIVLQDHDMILSPSPPPQPTQPARAQVTDTNQHVASLKAIFPDFDDAVILSVLESTGNDHDRALDMLLGMSDPDFVPPNPPTVPSPNPFSTAPSSDAQRLSQEALDEQLARRLALEEQHAAAQLQPQAGEGYTMYQPYQPRRMGRNGWDGQPQTQGQSQGGGRDTMAEFQEGFSRIAESGKKTFSSIVSKVRAKMQEFDQGQGRSWSQNSPSHQPPQPAPASYSSSYAPSTPQQGLGQGAYTQPYQYAQPANSPRQMGQSQPARTNTFVSSPPRSGVLRAAATEPVQPTARPQQRSYYDPNTRGYDLYGDDDDEEITINDATAAPAAPAAAPTTTSATVTAAAIPASAATQSPATPPHADGRVSPPLSSDASSPPSYTSPAPSPPSPIQASTTPLARPRSLSPTIVGAKGTTPGAPGAVDFSKLGLLPKRPISLVRPQSPPTATASAGVGAGAGVVAPRVATAHSESTTDSSTDREEPEFIENPFEDPKDR